MPGVTGINETQKDDFKFTAFPNPFQDDLNFRVNPTAGAQEIVIYNLQGKVVDSRMLAAGSGEQEVKLRNVSGLLPEFT